jgi:biopolymer transport protein ExbD
MARTFRRQRQSHPISELNVTNLIDLGFTLLIIFMIATPMLQQEQTIPMSLPIQSTSKQDKPDPDTKFESIIIKADGTFALGARPMSLVQLGRELDRIARLPKPPVIRLRIEPKATAQGFVTVMDELKKRGLGKITIDTQTSG